MLRKFLVAGAALALAGCASVPQSPVQQAAPAVNPARIDATLKNFTDAGKLAGASALVTVDGKEVYSGAFGYSDREAKKPMARDTIVQIYSMTKPITGVALMKLWEEGKFRLDDPVAKYIPELANVKVLQGLDAKGKPILVAPVRQMTIRDVTRHTAGLTYCGGDIRPEMAQFCADKPMKPEYTLDEFARRLGQIPLEYQPGEQWKYSFGVDVQALLVQRISGMPFDQYLKKTVLDPLGMKDTGFYVPPEKQNRLMAVYDVGTDGTLTRENDADALSFPTKRWPLTPGGYGLSSTLDDYSRFARMLLGEGALDGVRILQPSTVRLMSTSVLDPAVTDRIWLPSKGQVGFGIDFAVRIAPPKAADESSGAVGEFFWDGRNYTLFWVDPKNKLTAVFFTQYVPFGRVPAHKAFRDAVYEGFDPSAVAPKP
ncbi:CubicO group peptidase (beta-lactamase class C family) [Rhizomicrobium palustre]|uniref:CubicO group peptidase (Beta-lactamase class C family) n=1 Tax=Rhizomicrobium palustre TaxID=189966 RepID=A0A846MZK7_9PROT|nr:serine hydrolase domain-containing protein [Rhizomicrobium palustre]NIK88442.1 CubicO group peptidase (beta-lactamase class C family) [Rhizomicrobium palustre]